MSDWKSRAKPVGGGDWKSRARPVDDGLGVPDSPLRQALAKDPAEVVTVETPTGPIRMSRGGVPVLSEEEQGSRLDAAMQGAKIGALESIIRPLSGTDLMDEVAGVAGAMQGKPYAETADAMQRQVDDINRRGGSVEVAGYKVPIAKTLGGMVPALVGGPAAALGRVGLAGAQGLLSGFSASPARLARGEAEELAKDVGTAGAFGLGAGALGEGVARGLGAASSWLGSKLGGIVQGQATKDAADVAAEIASKKGQLGGESQKASRVFENMQRGLSGTPNIGTSPVSPDIQRRALTQLSDPSTRRLQEKVLERSLAEAPNQTAVVEALERELADLTAKAPAEAARRTADYFAQPVISSEITPRLMRTVAPRAGMAAAAYLGGRLYDETLGSGGNTGTVAGTGGAIGAIMGAPGMRRMLGNVASSNRVRAAVLSGLSDVASSAGAAAPGLARAAAAAKPNASRALEPDDESAVRAYLNQ